MYCSWSAGKGVGRERRGSGGRGGGPVGGGGAVRRKGSVVWFHVPVVRV